MTMTSGLSSSCCHAHDRCCRDCISFFMCSTSVTTLAATVGISVVTPVIVRGTQQSEILLRYHDVASIRPSNSCQLMPVLAAVVHAACPPRQAFWSLYWTSQDSSCSITINPNVLALIKKQQRIHHVFVHGLLGFIF